MMRWIYESGYPASKIDSTGIWISDKSLADDWRKGKISSGVEKRLGLAKNDKPVNRKKLKKK